MSSAAPLVHERVELAPEGDYLGPAHVTRVEAPEVVVRLGTGATVRAQLALAFPYQPAEGDVLLVIGKRAAHYVIGVLHGEGKAVLAFPGDVELRAMGGSLELTGDEGVSLRGKTVDVTAGKLRVVADAVVETLASAYRQVTGLLRVRAGQTHTVVDDAAFTKAKSATILTEETVKVNGKQIHLG